MSFLLPAGGVTVTDPKVTGTDRVAYSGITSVGASAITHSAVALGTSTADRVIMVIALNSMWNSTPSGTTLTIGGVSATEVTHIRDPATERNNHAHAFILAMGTGATSADIVLTGVGGNHSATNLIVYDLKGANSTPLSSGGQGENASSDTCTATGISNVAGGFVWAYHMHSRSGAATTWSGTAGINSTDEIITSVVTTDDLNLASTDAVFSSSTIITTPAGYANPNTMLAISMQPAS